MRSVPPEAVRQVGLQFCVEVLFLYFAALLFGASALGTILVDGWHVAYLAAASLLGAWLVWRVHVRVVAHLLILGLYELFGVYDNEQGF